MKKTSKKYISGLEKENDFLKKMILAVPASIHVLEINEKCETRPYWLTENYTSVTGLDPKLRNEVGFAGPEKFYHKEDSEAVRLGTKKFLEGPGNQFAFICRVKKHINESEWLYVRGGRIQIEEGKHHMAVLLFPINDKAVFNQLKLDLYLTEIARLQNRLTITKFPKTELKIVKLLGKGYLTKEVANQLYRSFDTINKHRRSFFRKLEIHKISELVSFA